ncbi:hypothetical protein N9B68_00065 [bacterium]|nr:hypothetical protein [bacterium]
MKRFLLLAAALCLFHSLDEGPRGNLLFAQGADGIEVQSGYKITRVATDKIASNIFCMAVDPDGRVFVSGPGYIKVLVDSDGDGVFENSTLFSDRLKSGAQGMAFDRAELLCTGDGGVWKFSDVDRDGVADGPPKKMLAIKTGGEHDAHAIRKGPSGWWYLIAGNGTPNLPEYNSMLSTPVKNPRAGFLLRISPDWQKKEIFAHGFRNAYDFDFANDGSIFVFDSDGERDISLPWYRPTRVFRIRAGDDAGWVSAGWKRPGYFFDMPLLVDSLGRGSPTGVKFGTPKRMPDGDSVGHSDRSIFVADWTFGRVLVSRVSLRCGTRSSFSDFAVAKGQTGFAVTDLDFDLTGDLLISVGGRGTEGGVYRVTPLNLIPQYVLQNLEAEEIASIPRERLLSKWMKSEVDNCPDDLLLRSFVGWSESDLRTQYDTQQIQRLVDYLNNSIVRMNASNAALWMKIFSDWSEETIPLVETWPESVKLTCRVSRQAGDTNKRGQILADILEALPQNWESLFLVRLGQLVFNGCGGESSKAMFAGYTPRAPLKMSRTQGAGIADQIAKLLETSRDAVFQNKKEQRLELGRLAALLGVGTPDLFGQICLELGKSELSLEERIHWLNCLASISATGDSSTTAGRAVVARSLAAISGQVRTEELSIDRNFEPRLRTLFQKLKQAWGEGFEIQLANELSGEGEQLFFTSAFSTKTKGMFIPKVMVWLQANPDLVASEHLDLLGGDGSMECLEVIRKFSDQRELQSTIISNLIRSPKLTDRDLFIAGLASSEVLTIKNSAIGLRRTSQPVGVGAILAASNALQRISWDKSTVSARDQLMMFVENETGQKFGYRPKTSETVQADVLTRVSKWIETHFPNEFLKNQQGQLSNGRGFAERIAAVDWSQGNAERGATVYKNLQCARCHDSGSRMGPRLEGLGKRFSRDDLFRAIIHPDEQVPERYRAVAIETVDGQYIQGAMVYESVDGITIQQTDGKTKRVNRDQIEIQTRSTKSLMPEGLLNQATDLDLADLYKFLSK